MKLTEIKPNERNPRTITKDKLEKLKKSIKDFDKMMSLRPIVVDENNVILGGNMRYNALKALGYKDIPDEWVKKAEDLTEEEKKRFIIEDNVGFGEWDFDMLANEWEVSDLQEWGLDLPDYNVDDFGDQFTLKDGDKEPFQQMTFTMADEQAELIKNAIADCKTLEEYKYLETFGNENTNGNALYLIVSQWVNARK